VIKRNSLLANPSRLDDARQGAQVHLRRQVGEIFWSQRFPWTQSKSAPEGATNQGTIASKNLIWVINYGVRPAQDLSWIVKQWTVSSKNLIWVVNDGVRPARHVFEIMQCYNEVVIGPWSVQKIIEGVSIVVNSEIAISYWCRVL